MKSTFIGKEKNEASFRMDFSAEDFEGAVNKAYQSEKNKYPLDGFRKGKVPRKLIEAKYGGDVFYEEAINHLFSMAYPGAIKELNLSPVDSPTVSFDRIEQGKGLEMNIKVTVAPSVDVKDYKNIKIEKTDNTVEDGDVEKELVALQKKHARMIVIEEPAQDGDSLIIDFEGFADGEQFEGGSASRQPLILGSNTFIPGFEEQLIGCVPGEERDVNVTFPKEYQAEELAGKDATFKCKVHDIKRMELSPLDDDFAVEVSEFETLGELKQDIMERLKRDASEKAESEMKNAMLIKLYEANEIDIPDVMVENEIEEMVREFNRQLQAQGLDINKYMEYLNKDIEEFKKGLKDDAYKKVKTRLLVEAVAEAEELDVSEEDVNKEISIISEQYGIEPDRIRNQMSFETRIALEQDIKYRKAIDYMFENAVIEK